MKKFKVTAKIVGSQTVLSTDKYEAGAEVRKALIELGRASGVFTDVRIVKVEEIRG